MTRALMMASTIIASFAGISLASAETVRDHRKCSINDSNCRDHRVPEVVVPPRPTPGVIVDPIRPQQPPYIVVDPVPAQEQTNPPMPGDNFGISCGQGRNILKGLGYSKIKAYDCEGRTYGYFAIKGHRYVQIKMNLKGEITSEQRVLF